MRHDARWLWVRQLSAGSSVALAERFTVLARVAAGGCEYQAKEVRSV